jgi:hypothetical protein
MRLSLGGESTTIFTKEYIMQLHDWIMNKCYLIVASPNQNGSVLVKDVVTGEKVHKQKYYYITNIRELHNKLIKPTDEGGFDGARDTVTRKVLTSNTVFRALLPCNLSQLTDSQKQMCGCEMCIVGKGLVSTLNAFCSRQFTALENAGALEEAMDYKFGVSVNGRKHRWVHPREVVAAMICAAPGKGNLHAMECCLGRCTNCPSLLIPDRELVDLTSAPKVVGCR